MCASPELQWTETAPGAVAVPILPRFRLLSPAIVEDVQQGLMWSAQGLEGAHEWHEAQRQLAGFRLGGYTDWRLPSVRELLGLVDWSRHDPAIDTRHFHALPTWYWTDTGVAGCDDYAWMIDFGRGLADFHPRTSAAMIRPVRHCRG